jgi:filamentous hemagglutinin family protein
MKPKALLSLLAVTGAVLNAEIAPAQTLSSNVRNLPLDNTLGTPGSSTDLNLAVAVESDRLQTPAQSSPAESKPQNKVNDVKIPVETRDLVSRVTENLFSALNGIINIQLATFLPIDPNSLAVGSNAQLNVGMALVESANNGTAANDRQVQHYIANSNHSNNPQLAKNATNQANVERTTSKNFTQPSAEATVDDLTQSKPNSSTATNESGTVGKSNLSQTKVLHTGNPIDAMTLPPLTPILGNQNKTSISSTTGTSNESATVGKNNPGETKVAPTVNPIAAMTLPPLTPIIKSSVSSTAKATNRINNPGKIEEARDRDRLSLDRPNSATSVQKVAPSTTSANSIQKIAPLDVNLIVTNDLLVKKDELGDLNIFSADTLGITNSSGISSTSLSQGKAESLSAISDRMLLKNGIVPTSLTGTKRGNIQAGNLDRLLIKNVGDVAIDSGKTIAKKDDNKENIALADTSNRLSLACGVALGEHKFTLVGQGGLLANPKDSLNSDEQDSLGTHILPSHWLCDNPAP